MTKPDGIAKTARSATLNRRAFRGEYPPRDGAVGVAGCCARPQQGPNSPVYVLEDAHHAAITDEAQDTERRQLGGRLAVSSEVVIAKGESRVML